jgi:tungsten cofactor oxidoreducase radical SAM maturase
VKSLGFMPNFVESEPQKLYLELTSACNLDCAMCYRKSWPHSPSQLPQELLEKILLEIPQLKDLKEVVVGGAGEPTDSPSFVYASRQLAGKHLTLTTNGTLLHQREICRVVADCYQRVVVSVDGEGETFLKIRGTPLEQVIAGIKTLKNTGAKQEILLQFVLNRDNAQDIFSVIDIAARLNLQGVIVSNVVPATKDWAVKILYSQHENPVARKLFNQVRNYSFRWGVNMTVPNYELKTDRRCRFVDDGATYLNCRGEVVPCYRFAHTSKEFTFGREKTVVPHVFGEIGGSSLVQIWNSPGYQHYRYTIYNNLYPSCLDCELVEGCEIVSTTTWDCQGNMPTCGDCLWARNFVLCP